MKKRVALSVCGFLLCVSFMAGAQGAPALGMTAAPVKVDGVMADREYSLVTEAAGMKVGLTWMADKLFVGLSAPTTGWVAVGLGSPKMDGAVMYIGYVKGDATELKVQKGAGHRHADTDSNTPIRYAMKEAGGQTVLEIALKSSEFITKGQKSLDLVMAMGDNDSFVSLHKARVTVPIALTW